MHFLLHIVFLSHNLGISLFINMLVYIQYFSKKKEKAIKNYLHMFKMCIRIVCSINTSQKKLQEHFEETSDLSGMWGDP